MVQIQICYPNKWCSTRFYTWSPVVYNYINNIAQTSNCFDFIIHADDTTLSTTLENDIRNTQNITADNILNTELKM